jgi:hypothetical protein
VFPSPTHSVQFFEPRRFGAIWHLKGQKYHAIMKERQLRVTSEHNSVD